MIHMCPSNLHSLFRELHTSCPKVFSSNIDIVVFCTDLSGKKSHIQVYVRVVIQVDMVIVSRSPPTLCPLPSHPMVLSEGCWDCWLLDLRNGPKWAIECCTAECRIGIHNYEFVMSLVWSKAGLKGRCFAHSVIPFSSLSHIVCYHLPYYDRFA